MTSVESDSNLFETIMQKYQVLDIIQTAKTSGWSPVWEEFSKIYDGFELENDQEKHIFTDLFFGHCLKIITPVDNPTIFLELLHHWFTKRNLESRNGALSYDEKISLLHFCINLRIKLSEFLTQLPACEVEKLPNEHQHLLISLWRQIFLEPFSALNLFWNYSHEPPEFTTYCKNGDYTSLMVASMYQPFAADEYSINSNELLSSSLPSCYKTILIYWMVNTPYFNSEEKHRQKLLKYVPEICSAIRKHPQILSSVFFLTFVQEVMTAFWRASYIGGNNVDALSAFGDLISFIMQKSFPCPKPKIIQKIFEKGEKIRIGYISRNFYKQAVSCYMVNRVIYHDTTKFEICVFALGDYHDTISELFKQHSDYFQRIDNMTDIQGIVKNISEQNLDMLIYPDIGMDPVTYILSGLQLAPIQCAMVGHGTTTGMPTIQYYISGDFEPSDAQSHYRENLIKLPNLGAAQYLPITPEEKISRKDLDIPEDAVVFISCANGIKHGHLRDNLFIEILKQAPNAWILLKPFASHASIDRVFSKRIAAAAKNSGVGDRLLILPPIGQTKHVIGLLSIADIQLDSYPYGGWTTNMEALSMGLPIVTQEGALARSRWGAGMLRALGITEGIAADEREYIAWAVKLAQNAELRLNLKSRITTQVTDILCNGATAQPAFEQSLIEIYHEHCRQVELQEANSKLHASCTINNLAMQDRITIATSILPQEIDNQRIALQSWKDAGFHVVSINALDEIAELYPYFADIDFVAATKDGRERYQKPYIYFDDMLAYFRNRKSKLCGIISPDIHLTKKDFYSFVCKEAENSFMYGSRVDVESRDAKQGQLYNSGFDYFFFDRKAIAFYPKQGFCFNLPWCDYWTVLVPLVYKLPVKKIISPVTVHLAHTTDCDTQTWIDLGIMFAQHFRPPFDLKPETMSKFAQETLSIINERSLQVSF